MRQKNVQIEQMRCFDYNLVGINGRILGLTPEVFRHYKKLRIYVDIVQNGDNGPIRLSRVLFGDQQQQGLSIAPTVANNTGDRQSINSCQHCDSLAPGKHPDGWNARPCILPQLELLELTRRGDYLNATSTPRSMVPSLTPPKPNTFLLDIGDLYGLALKAFDHTIQLQTRFPLLRKKYSRCLNSSRPTSLKWPRPLYQWRPLSKSTVR
jgi:hypothetical protein